MERKSLGAFIAALRKEKGLTQKQLAEKLGVTDKAVSRWEREESAPDLSLIPELADIFEITADELLRGRRQPKTAQHPTAPANIASFQIRTTISIGIMLIGLMTAMICRFAIGYRYGVLGYCIQLVFFLAAGICQCSFTISALAQQNIGQAQRDYIAGTIHNMMIVMISLLLGTITIMNRSLDAWEVLLIGAMIAVPVFSVLTMICWFWLYPRLAKSKGLFLSDVENEPLHQLRRETVLWVLWFMGLLALFMIFYSAVAHNAYPILIGGLTIGCVTIPICMIIYWIRKRHI